MASKGLSIKNSAQGYSKKAEIIDYLTNTPLSSTPQERIRQIVVKRLVEEYGYNENQIQTIPEFSVTKGSSKMGPFDIVVFNNSNKTDDNVYIIFETKFDENRIGVEQIKNYLKNTTAKYSVLYNGQDFVFLEKLEESPYFHEIPDIPKAGKTLAEVGIYKKSDLVPATELKTIFETCHNYIYANEGFLKEKVFNEVLKLIFIKMVDEKNADLECKFSVTEEEIESIEQEQNNEFMLRLNSLFDQVKNAYPDVFPDKSERINLKPLTTAVVVSRLQKYSLMNTIADIKGTAFQTFVHAHERGERGEFFTPYVIIELATRMLSPKEGENILDPACGSGGFLVSSMKYVFNQMDKKYSTFSQPKLSKLKEKNAQECIRGIDINPDLARVAKMHMILYDDGHTGIFSINSLDWFAKISEKALASNAGDFKPNMFQLILTNPPFGTKGKITDKKILSQFSLAHKWKKNSKTGKLVKTEKLQDGQVPDILFLERCIDLLADKGRMGVVVPDGILTNVTLEYVREFLRNNCRILGVVSLPVETFIPHGTDSKTSILFLQKLSKEAIHKLKQKNYPIFMAICQKIGYDIRGRTIYKRNSSGHLVNAKNKEVTNEDDAIIDTDIEEIISEFKKFKKTAKLDF